MDGRESWRSRDLRVIPYFTGLPEEALVQLASPMVERRYAVRSVVFLKGEPSRGLYVVIDGRIVTSTASAAGRQQVLHAFGPGRTFGDIAAFDGGVHPGTAEAWSSSTVGLIPIVVLQRVLSAHPQSILPAVRLFASRLRAFTRVVEDLSVHPVISRIARLLDDLSNGRPTLVEDRATPSPRLTQQDIAVMVGSVREVVQRELKTLERGGAIRLTRGRVHVVDPEKLAWFAAR